MPTTTLSADALEIAREQITKEIREDLRTGSGNWYNVFSSSSAEPSVLEQMAALRTDDNKLLGNLTAKASATLDEGEVKLEVRVCAVRMGRAGMGEWGTGWRAGRAHYTPLEPDYSHVLRLNLCS